MIQRDGINVYCGTYDNFITINRIKGGRGVILNYVECTTRFYQHGNPDVSKYSVRCIENDRTLTMLKGNGERQNLFKLADTVIPLDIPLENITETAYNDSARYDGNDTKYIRIYTDIGYNVIFTIDNCPDDIIDIGALCHTSYMGDVMRFTFDKNQIVAEYVGGGNSYFMTEIYLLAGDPPKAKYIIRPPVVIEIWGGGPT